MELRPWRNSKRYWAFLCKYWHGLFSSNSPLTCPRRQENNALLQACECPNTKEMRRSSPNSKRIPLEEWGFLKSCEGQQTPSFLSLCMSNLWQHCHWGCRDTDYLNLLSTDCRVGSAEHPDRQKQGEMFATGLHNLMATPSPPTEPPCHVHHPEVAHLYETLPWQPS